MAPALSKEFLDTQATVECGFTLKLVRDMIKTYNYVLRFIDKARFMASTLSNLVNNLSKGIHRSKFKYRHYDKNVKLGELNISISTVFLNIHTLKIILKNANVWFAIRIAKKSSMKIFFNMIF